MPAPVTQTLDLQRTLYQSRNPTRRWLHCMRRDWVLSQIRACGAVHRALEVGPGCGVYLDLLCSQARQVDACDVNGSYLRELHSSDSRENLRTIEDNIAATALTPNSYDLIVCSEVIEHLPESEAALSNLAALLSTNGRLILTTPQPCSPVEICAKVAFLPGIIQLVRWLYREPVEATGHINLLSARALKNQFDSAGLSIQEQSRCGFYLPLIAEFGGEWAARMFARCNDWLARSRCSWLLWNQCYVLKRAS